ncbi:MAG: hypothetical protein II814_10925 [Treponema sp.]|nr:hypothetical protein [Treponema sp.]
MLTNEGSAMAFYDDIPESREADEEKDGELHFFYKREERIKNAPKIVQDYYAGKMTPPKGLFKVLVATKFNRFMLLTVALCFVVVFFVNTFSNRPSLATAAGFELELDVFSYDESVYAQVKVHPLKKSLKDKNFPIDKYVEEKKKVVVDFSFVDADGENSAKTQKSAEIEKNAFFIRTNSPDYDIIEVAAQVNILGETIGLVSKVKRRE